MQFNNKPLSAVERFCLSKWYWVALAMLLAVSIGALAKAMGN